MRDVVACKLEQKLNWRYPDLLLFIENIFRIEYRVVHIRATLTVGMPLKPYVARIEFGVCLEILGAFR